MEGEGLIATTAAELMDTLDQGYPDNAKITEVMIIAVVTVADEDDQGYSMVRWRASDPAWLHQLGLVHGCLEGMQASRGKGS